MKRGCRPKSKNRTKKRNLFCEGQDCFTCGSLSDFYFLWFLPWPEVEANSNGSAIVILDVVGEKSGGMEKIYPNLLPLIN